MRPYDGMFFYWKSLMPILDFGSHLWCAGSATWILKEKSKI
ncbi:hypothetical protein GXM_04173 [Nostoc sphaeroides CCNUC1]|uniref:Uncharacterized protein n=1 Tax=Nostoc sphaeroides CCNUC1 TaxID=2653204 RepID=A0A5P8W212_9NOSO|nr:hypothetical protein GXM_04173 [Nostoc sphaeroides CCNUC1]